MTIIRKTRHEMTPPRPRTNEFVLVTKDNGDKVRYEFDYDDTHVYVYTGLWPADWPNGYGCKEQLPVRAIPMRGWTTTN